MDLRVKRYLRAGRSGHDYLDHINAFQVGLGERRYVDAATFAADVVDEVPGLGSLTECLEAPDTDPMIPPEGLRP